MKIGILGAGQMGSAMIRGWLNADLVTPQQLFVKGGHSGSAEKLQQALHFQLVTELTELKTVDVLVIATLPKLVVPLLQELKKVPAFSAPIASVAAGVSLHAMHTVMGESYPLASALPNTPVAINEGVTAIAFPETISLEAKKTLQQTFEALGKVIIAPEEQIAAINTVAGCGPAFVDLMMEALSDAAVKHGIPRAQSYEIISQMLIGSGRLQQVTNQHPAELKDAVTTPGGLTIKGVTALEEYGFRNALIKAIDAIL